VTGRPCATVDNVGEAGGGSPRVRVDRETDVPGQLDGCGVGVDDRAGGLVDDQDGDRDVGEDAGQPGTGAGSGAVSGDGGIRGGDDARLLVEIPLGVPGRGGTHGQIDGCPQRTQFGGRGVGAVASGWHQDNLTVDSRFHP
jgi:hypothetical protein